MVYCVRCFIYSTKYGLVCLVFYYESKKFSGDFFCTGYIQTAELAVRHKLKYLEQITKMTQTSVGDERDKPIWIFSVVSSKRLFLCLNL